MGPEFWKLDKGTKLKKCSEKLSHPCGDDTEGCCAVIPCEYCLSFAVTGEDTLYGTASESAGHWTGTIAGAAFDAFWERYPTCNFVVQLDGAEVYRNDCGGSVTCRDSSASAEVQIYPDTGLLTWTKREFRPLEHATDEVTNCKTFFCGECECTCDALCVTVIPVPQVEFEPYECEGMLPVCGMCPASPMDMLVHGELPDTQVDRCFGPDWQGTVSGMVFWIRLRRGPSGECVLSGTVDGEAMPEVTVTDCKSISASWTMEDGTQVTIACKTCNCETDPPPDVSDCCDSVPCMYCVTYTNYADGVVDSLTVIYSDGEWYGLIHGVTFRMYWVRDEYDVCQFIVELDGVEIYRKSIAEGQSCEDNSDSIDVVIGYDSGTITWTKYTPRPLVQIIDPDSYEQVSFCGTSDCTCPVLLATLVTASPDCCTVSGTLTEVRATSCDAPNWFGTLVCNGTPHDISLTLSRSDYDGSCEISGTVDGEEVDGTTVADASDISVVFFLYDGSILTVTCYECPVADEETCIVGCCWPLEYDYTYPCGYSVPVPFEISAPGCDFDGASGEFTPTGVADRGSCGACGIAPPVVIGGTVGVIKVPTPGLGYCMETPCSMTITLVLQCEDEASVYGLDECCGGFRLWVGTTERMVGWDGRVPSGGSDALYWIKVEPTSCSCDPLAMIFEVTLELDCPETWPDGGCVDFPKDCCIPICGGFTLTI